jgi:DNA-binding transcriptional LysR family regulator
VTLTDQRQQYYERTKPLVDEIQVVDGELTSRTLDVSGLVRVAAPSTFGRLHVLPLVPELLSCHPGLQVDLVLSDAVRDMVEDRIDLAIRVSPVDDPDSVVRRVAHTSLVCAGSRRYFEQHGIPTTPAELVDHNCLVDSDVTAWPFAGPNGRFSVPVRGNLSSNSVETILASVLAGVGIGMFRRASLVGEFRHTDVVTVLDEFVNVPRDVSLIWPKRRLVFAYDKLCLPVGFVCPFLAFEVEPTLGHEDGRRLRLHVGVRWTRPGDARPDRCLRVQDCAR